MVDKPKDAQTKAPAAKPKTPAEKPKADVVTLKQLCTELKIDAHEAREKLRWAVREPKKYPELAKVHKPRQPWEWAKDSPALKEARAALTA